MSKNWGTSNTPDLTDKVAIVTGGNIGLGYQTSLELARRGVSVIIACRSLEKGRPAVGSILIQ
jgi:NAD(P)-dependent dehydrogenase (short-subunit alcohol dehydrogenase family)